MKSSALLLFAFFLFPPLLFAQSVGPSSVDPGVAAPTTTTVPAPPRNIMPVGLNHKPNATPPPAEIARAIDTFFKTLHTVSDVNNNDPSLYQKAYDTFFFGTKLAAQHEKTSIFVSKTQEAFGLYGPLKDVEVFDNYSIGSNVLILTYLSRHEFQPLRWRFIYYRADKTWTLINMGFDDVLLDLLD